ncbi:motile sperm domain-containing protein 1-like isoform X1 [Cottoperca gobio]|uniref:Motile sperm domain-containing protein 1-like isoform X1 n=1 Tax=Cottoperca gobio TaxID=56716 RepID=A0A6J2PEB9_COTGO|nr:motile sperm domain-containing protein 1-like isoform X1 [Cottoperca gobio]XP_029283961.1 motile sperm domain-containing protein 1-like isoform X1 [Cottoperca gobio]XP_029283962.1 motile sperm domain-containing protein 1-like isoform X1 [Cottoperca gobio]
MRRKDSREGQGGAEQGGGREDRGQEVVRRAGGETGDVSPLPVFLFPSELLFYCEQRSSHRRVLTLYNPYSFSLCFKMMCTAPSLYRVVEAEGSVRAKSCVDLVVRHLDVAPRHRGRRDRFRLEVRGGGRAGGREIWAELRGGEEEGGREEEGGGGEERKRRGAEGQQRALSPLLVHTHLPTCTAVRSVSQWVVCAVLAVLCVAVLMLPLHTDSGSVVPRCLHVSTNQKLVCAYTLGLLTMVFLR